MNHRSGIHNFTNDEEYLKYNTQPKSEKEMVEIISKGKSDFEPDSKGDYSNSNYVLLSYILEKTYKKFRYVSGIFFLNVLISIPKELFSTKYYTYLKAVSSFRH